jgi:hypothetical protein
MINLFMTGLVEALANIVLFILTPVVVVWEQARLVIAIETVGKCPLEKNDAEAVNLWAGNHEHVMPDLSRSVIARATSGSK